MEISYLGHQAFRLKAKAATTVADTHISIEDFKITGPGEYEVRDVSVIGVADGEETVYVIEADGLRVAYISKVKEKLSESQIEDMGSIDILLLSVGEDNIKQAIATLKQVDPWVVIPTLGNTEVFLKEMGKEGIEAIPKFMVSPDKLPSDLTVVILEKK